MPLYEYKCSGCGRKFDVLQKFSDDPVTICEQCGSAVERLVSSPAFHFKGTGWYVTDYAKSNGVSQPTSEGAKEASGSGEKSEAKAESKGDSKPEAKPETPKPAASTSSTEK